MKLTVSMVCLGPFQMNLFVMKEEDVTDREKLSQDFFFIKCFEETGQDGLITVLCFLKNTAWLSFILCSLLLIFRVVWKLRLRSLQVEK